MPEHQKAGKVASGFAHVMTTLVFILAAVLVIIAILAAVLGLILLWKGVLSVLGLSS